MLQSMGSQELDTSWQLNNNLIETDLHLSLGLLFSPKRPYKYLNMQIREAAKQKKSYQDWVFAITSINSPEIHKYEIACILDTQSCLTLCDPMDYSLPGSSVHGIVQAVGCHALLQVTLETT